MAEMIERNPEILGGKPVIKGSRISVALILELLEAGETIEGIIDMYPHIKREEIFACIRYARKLVENVASTA